MALPQNPTQDQTSSSVKDLMDSEIFYPWRRSQREKSSA